MAEKRGIVLGWWVIPGEELMVMLWKAAHGQDPDLIYAEHYANCEVERAADD